jgi:hypothetical protein
VPDKRVANHKRQNTGFLSANHVELDFALEAALGHRVDWWLGRPAAAWIDSPRNSSKRLRSVGMSDALTDHDESIPPSNENSLNNNLRAIRWGLRMKIRIALSRWSSIAKPF